MTPLAEILIPISPGELLDRLSILRLKVARFADPSKLANVRRERVAIEAQAESVLPGRADLFHRLRAVNGELWDVEEALREHEGRGDFGTRFVELARSVYRLNDERARLKRRINETTGSALTEEKSYAG